MKVEKKFLVSLKEVIFFERHVEAAHAVPVQRNPFVFCAENGVVNPVSHDQTSVKSP